MLPTARVLKALVAAVLALALGLAVGGLTAELASPPMARAATPLGVSPWPGPQGADPVDAPGFFGDGLSGLAYEAGATPADDRLWGVHDHGRLFRLVSREGLWVADSAQGWGAGKRLAFPGGGTRPDAEGVVVRDGIAWVAVERDASGATRHSILRVPLTGDGAELRATGEWNLGSFYPGVSPNLGPESVTAVPNRVLIEAGFVDDSTGRPFDPATHPEQQGGQVFFVVVEASGPRDRVDAFVLGSGGVATRVASFANPVGNTMALDFDESTRQLWAVCDHYCDVRSAVFEIDASGRFQARAHMARPTGLPNHNFEGFAIAPVSRCTGGTRPVFWANDANDAGRALWAGRVNCPAADADFPPGAPPTAAPPTVPTPPTAQPTAQPTVNPTVSPTVSPTAGPDPGPTDAVPRVRLASEKLRAGMPQVLRVLVPGDDGGTVNVTFGSVRRTAVVRDGEARVALPALRTAGVRAWDVRWSNGAIQSRAAGRLRVWKARSAVTAALTSPTIKVGRPVQVRVRVSTGVSRPGGRWTVRIGSRLLATRVVPWRSVAGGPGQFRIRVQPGQRGLRTRGVRTLSITYRGTPHTTAQTVRVKVRLR